MKCLITRFWMLALLVSQAQTGVSMTVTNGVETTDDTSNTAPTFLSTTDATSVISTDLTTVPTIIDPTTTAQPTDRTLDTTSPTISLNTLDRTRLTVTTSPSSEPTMGSETTEFSSNMTNMTMMINTSTAENVTVTTEKQTSIWTTTSSSDSLTVTAISCTLSMLLYMILN